MDSILNPYDEVLYGGDPYPQTHPDRLATLAKLFGMQPAPVESCSVLEVGCGDGGNLIPMALGLPGSTFLGIDLAPRPIAKGNETIAALDLGNIALRVLDIKELSPDLGQFDYIIAHGIYSWIPADIREKLLEICRASLNPHGVAYISYNALPGGHFRNLARELMMYHAQEFTDPTEQVYQARAFLQFVAESETEPDLYRMILKKELERILEYRDSSLYHDDLAEINTSFYFSQFVGQATRYDLKYLAEADFHSMQDRIFQPKVREMLHKLTDNEIVREQYMDFLRCRRFRQTLLCHKEVTLNRTIRPERLRGLYIASAARLQSGELDPGQDAVVKFQGPKGSALSTNNPLAKAAIAYLGELWPQGTLAETLTARARTRTGGRSQQISAEIGDDELELYNILLEAYAAGVVEVRTYMPRFSLSVTERPIASPLARLQIRNANIVTTLRHTNVEVKDDLAIHLLRLLDGSRDRQSLLTDLFRLVESENVVIHHDKGASDNGKRNHDQLSDQIDANLTRLARLALLIA